MATSNSTFEAKIVVPTLAFMRLQTIKALGLPMTYKDKSTLNEHLDVLATTLPASDIYPVAQYMCIGDKGHYMADELGDGEYVPMPVRHSPTDVAPYRIRPLVLRRIDNDLSDSERAKYALRKLTEIGGVKYWAYYLIRLSMTGVSVNDYKVTVEDGVRTTEAFTYTDSELYPTQPEMPDYDYDFTDQTVTSDGKYVSSSAAVSLMLDAAALEEYLNVCKIIKGSAAKSVISEVCLVTGVDTTATGESYTGAPFTYNEVTGAQIAVFMTTFNMASMANDSIKFTMTIGQTAPMPVRVSG